MRRLFFGAWFGSRTMIMEKFEVIHVLRALDLALEGPLFVTPIDEVVTWQGSIGQWFLDAVNGWFQHTLLF